MWGGMDGRVICGCGFGCRSGDPEGVELGRRGFRDGLWVCSWSVSCGRGRRTSLGRRAFGFW